MRSLSILLVALSLGSLSAAGALAQSQPNAPAKSQTTGNAASSGANTSGSTGFTNWSRDASQGGTAPAASPGAGRPETATGLDLNGSATRYPSGKAPE
jgi:hypothetical protein